MFSIANSEPHYERIFSPPPALHIFPKGTLLGDLPALIELCSLLASSGREKEALEQFNKDINATGEGGATVAITRQGAQESKGFGALLAASALTPVHLMLRLGEIQAARQLLADGPLSSTQLDSQVQGGGGAIRQVR